MKWQQLLDTNRRRQTASQGDYRIEFERDFDRCVFSTPVKRLQDKAQVFPLEQHDAVRTRLTHSLEVSSVACGLATYTAAWLLEQKEIKPGMERSIEAIARTCGLIHDLGNPPFGHAGELAIRSWFQSDQQKELLQESLKKEQFIQDFLKFEGNAQSLRLVATLQVLADYSGLNLTFGTLSALSKYTASSDKARQDATNPAHQKPGYFASEAKIVEEIRDATGTGEARNPISLLVEAADDIVYLAADVEDGVKKGVLSWLDVRNALTDEDSDSVRCALETQEQILKAGDSQVPLNNDINVSAFRTAAIHVMVEGAFKVFTKQYNKIIEGTYEHSLLPESDAAPLMSCLRKIGKVNVYPTRSTLTLELMGRHVIWGLLDIFWEGASEMPTTGDLNTTEFSGKAAALFSANYQQVFRQFVNAQTELPEDYHRLQLVTDYICGMTDSFAKRLHAMLFNGR